METSFQMGRTVEGEGTPAGRHKYLFICDKHTGTDDIAGHSRERERGLEMSRNQLQSSRVRPVELWAVAKRCNFKTAVLIATWHGIVSQRPLLLLLVGWWNPVFQKSRLPPRGSVAARMHSWCMMHDARRLPGPASSQFELCLLGAQIIAFLRSGRRDDCVPDLLIRMMTESGRRRGWDQRWWRQRLEIGGLNTETTTRVRRNSFQTRFKLVWLIRMSVEYCIYYWMPTGKLSGISRSVVLMFYFFILRMFHTIRQVGHCECGTFSTVDLESGDMSHESRVMSHESSRVIMTAHDPRTPLPDHGLWSVMHGSRVRPASRPRPGDQSNVSALVTVFLFHCSTVPE